jgi:hypothetical protein
MNKFMWIGVLLAVAFGCEERQPEIRIAYDHGPTLYPLYEYSFTVCDRRQKLYLAAGDNRGETGKGHYSLPQYWFASLEVLGREESCFVMTLTTPAADGYTVFEISNPDHWQSKAGWVYGSGRASVTRYEAGLPAQLVEHRELEFAIGPTESRLPVTPPAGLRDHLVAGVSDDPVAAADRAEEARANQEAGDDRYPHPAVADLLGKHNLNQLRLGMSREEVEAILGMPNSIHEWPTITVAATYTYRLEEPDVEVDLVFIEGLREIRLWRTTGEGAEERRLAVEYYQPYEPLEGAALTEPERIENGMETPQ